MVQDILIDFDPTEALDRSSNDLIRRKVRMDEEVLLGRGISCLVELILAEEVEIVAVAELRIVIRAFIVAVHIDPIGVDIVLAFAFARLYCFGSRPDCFSSRLGC